MSLSSLCNFWRPLAPVQYFLGYPDALRMMTFVALLFHLVESWYIGWENPASCPRIYRQ
jgi:hypothetical protein